MIVVAILGLIVPGYLLARALDARFAWAAAFPVSALLLTETVIGFAIFGVPIRFGFVLAVLALVTAICAAWWLIRSRRPTETIIGSPEQSTSKWLVSAVAIQVGIVLIALAFRTTLVPLCGPDTPFRWDALPRLMLEHESLSYYPPVTVDDFAKYTYPDGVPPLTASVYWWLYAALGTPNPNITSIAIFLQLASCFALVYYAARTLFEGAGGWIAIAILATCTLFLRGVAIGQETGYTALSFAGQLAFALAAYHGSRANNVVIAGLFGGLGALSREYGPLLALCGFFVLLCHRETRRHLPLYCLVVTTCGAPWYIRNWVITGNPLYALDVFGFPSNPVHVGILATYHERFAISNITADTWRHVAVIFLLGAPLVLLTGLAGIAAAGRRGIALALCAAIALCLWLSAIAYTAGGIDSTLRVLTPFWVVLAIGAGTLASTWTNAASKWRNILRGVGLVTWLVCAGYATASALAFPFEVTDLPGAILIASEEPMAAERLALAKKLETINIPATGVLTDDCYLAVALKRFSRFQPVMVWSPAMAFIFDAQLEPAEIRRRLIENHIALVSVWPESPNNTYLLRSPLYRDDSKNWFMVIAYPNVEAIFAFTLSIPSGVPFSQTPER
jgi:hypothetical protein